MTSVLGTAGALIVSFLIGTLFILLVGRNPFEVFERFFSGTLGSTYGIGQVLFKATPLMFTGLSAAICFRAGLFNIGAEGQLTIGAFMTAIAGAALDQLPGPILTPLCILAGAAGGALWGVIPGVLKARFGSHEVINTIMMNFIAAGVVSYFTINVFAVPATVHTPEIGHGATLMRLESLYTPFQGSPVNLSFILAIICCVAAHYVITSTRWGYEIRLIGMSPPAAEYGRINIRRNVTLAFAAAGACAGLVGSNFVMGYKHYFELGFSDGIGFIGIAVALLARNNSLAIILTSLFFGMLEFGSLSINTLVPKELSNILQAIVILLMISMSRLISLWVRRRVHA